jgi:hypothetical protein
VEVKDRWAAQEFAYGDVKQAFEYYIRELNQGRPFIIAGHSQGSRIGVRLVADMVEGQPIRDRFIAAYLVGAGIPMTLFGKDKDFRSITPCGGPRQLGVICGFDTVPSDFPTRQRRHFSPATHQHYFVSSGSYEMILGAPCLAVNPMTWSTEPGPAPAEHKVHRDGVLRHAAAGASAGQMEVYIPAYVISISMSLYSVFTDFHDHTRL